MVIKITGVNHVLQNQIQGHFDINVLVVHRVMLIGGFFINSSTVRRSGFPSLTAPSLFIR